MRRAEQTKKKMDKNRWTDVSGCGKHLERGVPQILSEDYIYLAFYADSIGKH